MTDSNSDENHNGATDSSGNGARNDMTDSGTDDNHNGATDSHERGERRAPVGDGIGPRGGPSERQQ